IGFLVILQTAGIDLSALTILIGSVGIGIGLGLQDITSNFIAGLVILFESPVRIGDRIEVGKLQGDVVKIAARATTILTNDNIAAIIPNSELISGTVVNWSYPNNSVRCNVPVGVARDTDPDRVKDLLSEVAQEHRGVLNEPSPDVLFDSAGTGGLNFRLRVWTVPYLHKPGSLRSELNFLINKKFREEGIDMPVPPTQSGAQSGATFEQ